MDEYSDKYAGMPLKDVAAHMLTLREEHTEVKTVAATIWREHEYLSKHVLPEMMEEMGMTSVNLDGLGRLEIRHDASCSVPKENKLAVYQWLEDNGYGELIVGTVNSSTFKAQIKKFIKDGEEFPMELINFSPYDNAVLIKAK